ncbi:hypothetical protein P691DRAFT_760473 [Macrolepiota fuliginosa MF-IS2]|uniref:Uncharacterized protein n=1 Tax=Macrolepiota fuliginosa MF-IS2 TaxID=1400762 RepID=A0A9P5XAM0_9AGAR|nr:hypothetical protein P691DRAFT_760473 [Macrolepiota fuliginosa MF-IS2]
MASIFITIVSASDPKLSDTTVAFLNAQNQDLHTKSIVQTLLLVTLPKLVQIQVHRKLNAIGFTYEAPALPLPPTETHDEEEELITEDEANIHLFNDALATLYKWHIFKLAKAFNVVKILAPPTPSPPPPYTQPHSDEEDIHMEPPTPTCVFSEAAMQTPAPLPVLATSAPPPLPAPPGAAVASSKPGPPSRPSFAKAAVKTLCPNAPPPLHEAHHVPHSPQPRPPKVPSQASTRNNLISLLAAPLGASSTLRCYQQLSSLHIDSAQFTNSGIMCATASVPIQSDLNIVEATLPPKIARSQASLPSSQSFIKIMDIPYFKPSTTEPPNRQEIGDQLIPSPIPVNMIEHARFVHNSPKADSGTFWINLVDSQQGTLASSLISH